MPVYKRMKIVLKNKAFFIKALRFKTLNNERFRTYYITFRTKLNLARNSTRKLV